MEELNHSEFLYRLSTSLVKRVFRLHPEDCRRVLNILLDPSIPLYISGLASRVIALVLARGHNFENCYERGMGIVNGLVRVLNRCSAEQRSPTMCQNTLHKIQLNCSAALTLLDSQLPLQNLQKWQNPLDPIFSMAQHATKMNISCMECLHCRNNLQSNVDSRDIASTASITIPSNNCRRNKQRSKVDPRYKASTASIAIPSNHYSNESVISKLPKTKLEKNKKDVSKTDGLGSSVSENTTIVSFKPNEISSFIQRDKRLGYRTSLLWLPKTKSLVEDVAGSNKYHRALDNETETFEVLDMKLVTDTESFHKMGLKYPSITTLRKQKNQVYNKEKEIRSRLHADIRKFQKKLPLKFLLRLSKNMDSVNIEFQEVRKRAYLMVMAWIDEYRLRRMAVGLIKWWNFVVHERSEEYRIGIATRIIWSAIRRYFLQFKKKKFKTWAAITIEAIEAERDAAARLLQRVYRGYGARCAFAEHARRWLATIPIQTVFRKYICKTKYDRVRYLIIKCQAHIRSFLCQCYLRLLTFSATKIESVARMFKCRKVYIVMETSVCSMQTTFRAWQARKTFYCLLEKRVRVYEIQLMAAMIIQRLWRGYHGRIMINCIKEEKQKKDIAAIRIQKWWYDVNGQFATFFLMRMLALDDELEKQRHILKYRSKKYKALLLLQCYVKKWIKKRNSKELQQKTNSVRRIQKIWRGRNVRKLFLLFVVESKAACTIQSFYRYYRKFRASAAFCIQRLWFRKHANGTTSTNLLKHLRLLKIGFNHAQRLRNFERKNNAMAKVQRLLRSYLARHLKRKKLAARTIQVYLKTFLRGQYEKRRLDALKDSICSTSLEIILKSVFQQVSRRYAIYLTNAVTVIQRNTRAFMVRLKFIKTKQRVRMRKKAAMILICAIRRYRLRMQGLHVLESESCRRQNVFANVNNIHSLIRKIYDRGEVYYSRKSIANGMGVATILLRLGFDFLTQVTKAILREEGLRYRLPSSRWHDLPQKEEWPLLIKIINKKPEKLRARYKMAIKKLQQGAKVPRRRAQISFEEDAVVDLAIKRITLLSSGDLTTVKYFSAVSGNTQVCSIISLIAEHFGCSKSRAKKLCKQFPVEKVSFFQFESYIKRFEKGDERTFKALLPEMTSSFAGPGWLPHGVGKNRCIGFMKEEEEWETIRYLRCYELYQMGLEKLLNLTSVTQYYLWGKVKRVVDRTRSIWHWHARTSTRKFLYSCGGRPPPVVKLYVQVDSMGEALVSIEHLNKACLHVQRLFRGRVGRNIAKNMRARVFLSRASIDYFTYRSSISNGTYVKHVAAQDREKERLAKKQNRVDMEISFHRENLNTVLQFGYVMHEDQDTGTIRYIESSTGTEASKKPLYAVKHLKAVLQLQNFYRIIAAKHVLRKLRLCKSRNDALEAHRKQWNKNKKIRSRLVHISFDFTKSGGENRPYFRRKAVSFSLIGCRRISHSVAAKSHSTQDHINNCEPAKNSAQITPVANVTDVDAKICLALDKDTCNQNQIHNLRRACSHRMLKPGTPIHSLFGWVKFQSRKTTRVGRVPISFLGLSCDCWIFKSMEIAENVDRIRKEKTVTPRTTESRASHENAPMVDSLPPISYTEKCSRIVATIASSNLLKKFKALRQRRRGNSISSTPYTGAVGGLKGLVFREIILANTPRKGRRRYGYRSCNSACKSSDVAICGSKDSNLFLYLTNDTLKMHLPRKEEYYRQLDVRVSYSFVQLRYGWHAYVDESNCSKFYTNSLSGESVWEEPEYTAVDDLAARKIQPIIRGFLGRRCILKEQQKVSIIDPIVAGIKKTSRIGWVGYGSEGLTTEMLMLRTGLHVSRGQARTRKSIFSHMDYCAEEVLNTLGVEASEKRRDFLSVIDLVRNDYKFALHSCTPLYHGIFTETLNNRIQGCQVNYGFQNASSRHNCSHKSGKKPFIYTAKKFGLGEDFGFLATKEDIENVLNEFSFSTKYKLKIIQAVYASSYPVSCRMLTTYLKLYRDKPRLCSERIHEVCDLPTCSSLDDEKRVYQILKALATKTLAKADTLKLHSVSRYVNRSLGFAGDAYRFIAAVSSKGGLENIKKCDISSAFLTLVLPNCVKSGLVPDFKKDWSSRSRKLQYVFPALILRVGLEWAICCDRASRILQTFMRFAKYKCLCRRKLKLRHQSASRIQARWRGVLGRRHAFAKQNQLQSLWQQLYDESRLMYYFFDNYSQTSHWTAPSIPFQPYGWWPRDVALIVSAPGYCCECFTEKSTRQCDHCVNPVTGENQSYCFACFAMKHNGSRDLLTHTYSLIGVTLKYNCVCIECDTVASVKCSDCEDFFCKACFKRIHRKGNRKLHVKYSFSADAEMCVECNHDIASLKCINCCDYFCHSCFEELHRNGRKRKHDVENLNFISNDPVVQEFQLNRHKKKANELSKKAKDWRKFRPSRPPPGK